MAPRKILCMLFLLTLCLAGCNEIEYTGILVGYDEINAKDCIYWLKFEDKTEWKVKYDGQLFPLGKRVRIIAKEQQNKPPNVTKVEVLRSSGPVEPVFYEPQEKQ